MRSISTDAAQELLAAYGAIASSKYQKVAGDKPLIGLVGVGVPREVIHGFAATPVQLAGLEETRTGVAEFMEEFTPWHWQGIGEGMLRGNYRDFAAVVLDRSHQHFYYYLKEMQRHAAGRAFPPVLLLDWIQAADKDHSIYQEAQVASFTSSLERITGRTYAPALAQMAAREYNEMRVTLRAFQASRSKSTLSGSEAYKLMAASHAMSPARYRKLLAAVMDCESATRTSSASPRILLVSSHSMISLKLHEAVEAAGCRVVAESDWWGTRCAHDDVPLTGDISDMCTFYACLGIGEFVAPMAKRIEWYHNLANFKGVDFAVLHHSSNDEYAGWDYPFIIQALARMGIVGVAVEGDIETAAGRQRVTVAVGQQAQRVVR